MKLLRLYCGLTKHGLTIPQEQRDLFLHTVVSTAFPGFTVYETTGYWKGMPERSFIIELATDTPIADRITMAEIGKIWAVEHNQDSVLMTESDTAVSFITRTEVKAA